MSVLASRPSIPGGLSVLAFRPRPRRYGRTIRPWRSARAIAMALVVLGGARSWADGPAPGSGPRELLRQGGVDDSQFARLVDRKPWMPDEDELLQRVMFRLRAFPLIDVERWARKPRNFMPWTEMSERDRGEIFPLRGRVVSIEVIRPPAEVARRLELDQYYRAEFTMDEDGRSQPAMVFTRVVPRAWQKGGKIDQPAGAWGLFLKLAAADPKQPVPVFAAARIAWHPKTLLGQLGMDVGLLDGLEDRRSIEPVERECFYQMLAAAGRAKPGQLMAAADAELRQSGREAFSVVPLFNDPIHQRGKLVALAGTARRVLRVQVDDPDIVERFGIDHYYELYVFTDDSQGNPVVFCVRELPEGMPTGDGPDYAESVCVAGFFLKSWSYRSGAWRDAPEADREKARKHARQLAPLLIGREPVWRPAPTPSSPPLVGAIAGGAFLLVLLGIWFALWRYPRGDRRLRRKVLDRVDHDANRLDPSPENEAANHRGETQPG